MSFGGDIDAPDEIQNTVLNQLYEIELAFDLKSMPPVTSAPERLRSILTRLHQTTGQQAVILVDEYDRPVLNVLDDAEKARNLLNIRVEKLRHCTNLLYIYLHSSTSQAVESYAGQSPLQILTKRQAFIKTTKLKKDVQLHKTISSEHEPREQRFVMSFTGFTEYLRDVYVHS